MSRTFALVKNGGRPPRPHTRKPGEMDHRVAAGEVRRFGASDPDLGAAGAEHRRGGGPGSLGVMAREVVDDPELGALVEQRGTEAASDEAQPARYEDPFTHRARS